MESQIPRTANIGSLGRFVVDTKLFFRILGLMLKAENRARRREKGIRLLDTLCNLRKLGRIEKTLLRRRYMVRFGNLAVLDSTLPPFPSKAMDRRLSNYISTFDMTELPSGIISISTTNQCPYSCAFCSTNARHEVDSDLDEELLKKTISQIEQLGVPTIILHGGEPMHRYERFLRLVRHVSDETCLWMFTTGYGVTQERAAELKANGLFGAWVSLDHYDPQVHNRLRGHSQAFQNACSAIENLKRAGVYTCLSLVPPPDLLAPDKFKRYYDMARDLGAAEIRVMEVKPSGRAACRGVMTHSPVLERMQKELFHDPSYRNHPPLSGLSTWLEKDEALGCQCRFEYLFVTSTGEVQPCEATEVSFGNIREEDFLDIYQRACEAFRHPSTGCIPMIMYQEVRRYQELKDQLSSHERCELATSIIREFESKGTIPGGYRPLWSLYERRLEAYRKRRGSTP